MRILLFGLILVACNAATTPNATTSPASGSSSNHVATDSIRPAELDASGKVVRIEKSDAEWKQMLSDMEYKVLRHEGTERAFSGDLWNHHEKGTYTCRGCALPLFASDTKFDSGTGWPSYYQPIDQKYITENRDESYGMIRVEVECARCGGHLGHVFDDGPRPTGLRYCINSASLDFVH
jgi:peptide-methionine (R)-S-oxide reductase